MIYYSIKTKINLSLGISEYTFVDINYLKYEIITGQYGIQDGTDHLEPTTLIGAH